MELARATWPLAHKCHVGRGSDRRRSRSDSYGAVAGTIADATADFLARSGLIAW